MLSAEDDYWCRRVAAAGCRGIPVVEPGVAGQVIPHSGLGWGTPAQSRLYDLSGPSRTTPRGAAHPHPKVGIVNSGGDECGLTPDECPPGPSEPLRCVEFHGMAS